MIRLTGPVGVAPRKGQGAPTKNAAADVETVRLALRANGFMVAEGDKPDAGLIKAILAAQKKAGLKQPDGVVDPDGRTWAFLLPKYEAAEKEARKVELFKVEYNGKTVMLTARQLEEFRAEVFGRLEPYIRSILSNHKVNARIHQDYLDTAMLRDGYLNAVAQVIVIKAGGVKMPDIRLHTNSIKAAGALERALMSKDLGKLDSALPEAEQAISAFSADMRRFLKEFTGSAATTAEVLTVTSAVCFAVVGALATPVLVTGMGISALSATMASGAGVAVIQSASQELGKHASGQKVTLFESLGAVVVDGTVGLATAGIAAKLPLGFVKTMAGRVAPGMSKALIGVSAQQAEKILVQFFTSTGEGIIKAAVGEALTLLGKSLKTGKAPTDKDLEDAVQKILVTALTSGLTARLGTFQKQFAMKNRDILEGRLFPEVLKKLAKANDLPPVLKARVWAEVYNKISEEVLKTGTTKAIDAMKGNESPEALVRLAGKEIEADTRLRKLVETEMEKALKKHKVEAK